MPLTAFPYRCDGTEDVRPACEKRRGLAVQCFEILQAEPNAIRRERLQWEVDYWLQAIQEGRDENCPNTVLVAENQLRKFLQRETK